MRSALRVLVPGTMSHIGKIVNGHFLNLPMCTTPPGWAPAGRPCCVVSTGSRASAARLMTPVVSWRRSEMGLVVGNPITEPQS